MHAKVFKKELSIIKIIFKSRLNFNYSESELRLISENNILDIVILEEINVKKIYIVHRSISY